MSGPQRFRTSVLIVGPAWAGDMVMAQSLFKLLKQQREDIAIDVLAPAWTRALTARMPEVRRSIDMPLGHGQLGLKTRYRLGVSLRNNHYRQAIVLPNSWKSALTPFAAAIPRRTGYLGEQRWGLLNDIRRLDKNLLPMTVERFAALGLARDLVKSAKPALVPRPVLTADALERDKTLQRLGLSAAVKKTPLLALCPGAEYGPAKRWPGAYFAAIARNKLEQGWQVWLFGSANDQPVAAEINAAAGGRCTDLSGKTALGEAIDLLSLADLVISNDSGLMHVAAALDRKLIALYGSSDPKFTPPLSDNAKIIRLGLECSPCFQRSCPLGHLKCLRDLTPQQVLAAIEQL